MGLEDKRLYLQQILEGVLGTTNVYFQPPPGFSLQYPCIVYERTTVSITPADNSVYRSTVIFKVTLFTQDSGSSILEALLRVPGMRHERSFRANLLYNDVLNITL